MKKLSTALLLSTAFLAGSAQANWDGNWLFGISEGGVWHSGGDDSSLTVTVDGIGSETFNTNRHDDNDGRFIWGFLAGYQVRACNWLVGLEVNVNWRSDEDHHNFFAFSDTLGAFNGTIHQDRDAIWGITGRFGYFINTCIMPYIRLGATHSDRDFDVSLTRFVIDDGVITGESVTASVDDDSNNRWSFVGGIGLEWFLPGCLSLRAEWDYHNRKHHDNAITTTAVATDGITTFSINGGSGHHHEQTAIASLVYNF